MAKDEFWKVIKRLRKPSVLLSLLSHVLTLFITMGLQVNEHYIMSIATIACSILVTLGILSNPDTTTKGYGDDYLICSASGRLEPHVPVNGKMVCTNCGAVHDSGVEDKPENPGTPELVPAENGEKPVVLETAPVKPEVETAADITAQTNNTEQANITVQTNNTEQADITVQTNE